MTGITIAPPTSFKPPSPPKLAAGKFKMGGGIPEKMGFEPISTVNKKKNIFLIIAGKEGTGKNRLAYSAIEEGRPVLEMAVVERGSEGDANTSKYTSKGILRKLFVTDDKDTSNKLTADRLWHDFQETMYALYDFEGTLIVNSIDEIYGMARDALLPGKSMRRDYGEINQPMNDLLGWFQRVESKTNLILLSKGLDLWTNGEVSEIMCEYRGYPNARFMADAIVSLGKKVLEEPQDKKLKGMQIVPVDRRFFCTILKSPADISQEGVRLMGNDINFLEIKRRTLPQG